MNGNLYDLRTEYVESVGRMAALLLLNGQPVSMDYQPGNGTRYELVFTPARALKPVAGEVSESVPNGVERDGGVVVTLLSGSARAYPINLLKRQGSYLAERYVAEHWAVSDGDAEALTALFVAIAKAADGAS